MVNMTFNLPAELHKLMKKHSDVKWAEVARQAIWTKARDLELLDHFTAKSTMTMEDVVELDDMVKKSMWEKHNKMLEGVGNKKR
jgi:hypothetical protein